MDSQLTIRDGSLCAELEKLAIELEADAAGSRWGLHGHSAVDDDYFLALEYAAAKIRALLKTRQRKRPSHPD